MSCGDCEADAATRPRPGREAGVGRRRTSARGDGDKPARSGGPAGVRLHDANLGQLRTMLEELPAPGSGGDAIAEKVGLLARGPALTNVEDRWKQRRWRNCSPCAAARSTPDGRRRHAPEQVRRERLLRDRRRSRREGLDVDACRSTRAASGCRTATTTLTRTRRTSARSTSPIAATLELLGDDPACQGERRGGDGAGTKLAAAHLTMTEKRDRRRSTTSGLFAPAMPRAPSTGCASSTPPPGSSRRLSTCSRRPRSPSRRARSPTRRRRRCAPTCAGTSPSRTRATCRRRLSTATLSSSRRR